MSKIIMLRGLPASGKSTYAKEQVLKSKGKIKRVNKDELRALLDCGEWSKANEKFVLAARDALIVKAIESGFDVIVDDTNFSPKHLQDINLIAFGFSVRSDRHWNVEVEVVEFDAPLWECIERDSKRDKPVGAGVITNMWAKYVKPQAPHDPTLPDCIICDIDGTLAKMNGRGPFEWEKVGTDLVSEPIKSVLEHYANDTVQIILVSGRSDICRKETEEWLEQNHIPYNQLHMRPHSLLSVKDTLIKGEVIYDKEIKGKYNVLFVLDDRDQVVHLWRGLGLTCLQVGYGSF